MKLNKKSLAALIGLTCVTSTAAISSPVEHTLPIQFEATINDHITGQFQVSPLTSWPSTPLQFGWDEQKSDWIQPSSIGFTILASNEVNVRFLNPPVLSSGADSIPLEVKITDSQSNEITVGNSDQILLDDAIADNQTHHKYSLGISATGAKPASGSYDGAMSIIFTSTI